MFLAREARTLTQLRGLPQRFLTKGSGPQLDLSQSAITLLGLTCLSEEDADELLVAAQMPACLETLQLCTPKQICIYPGWSHAPGDDPPGCLARLRTIACTCTRYDCSADDLYVSGELGRAGVELVVVSRGEAHVRFHSNVPLFRGRALHVRTHSLDLVGNTDELFGSFLNSGVHEVCLVYQPGAQTFVWRDPQHRRIYYNIKGFVNLLMGVRGHEFAFEARDGFLAWCRWPPAGTPAWQTAAERHEAARLWAENPQPLRRLFNLVWASSRR